MFDFLPNPLQGFARSAGEALYPNMWAAYLGGMTPCLGFGGRSAPDLSPYRCDGTGSAIGLSLTESPIGPAIRFFVSATMQWNGDAASGNKFKVGGNHQPITLHAYFRYVAQPSARSMSLLRSDNPIPGSAEYGYHFYVDAYNNKLKFEPHRGERIPLDRAMPVYASPGNSLREKKWHNVAVTWYPPDADSEVTQWVMMNIDGTWIYPHITGMEAFDIAHLNSHHSRCGSSFGHTAVDIEVALVHAWNRRLPWREIDLLMVDPTAMFRRRAGAALSRGARDVFIGGAVSRRVSGVSLSG